MATLGRPLLLGILLATTGCRGYDPSTFPCGPSIYQKDVELRDGGMARVRITPGNGPFLKPATIDVGEVWILDGDGVLVTKLEDPSPEWYLRVTPDGEVHGTSRLVRGTHCAAVPNHPAFCVSSESMTVEVERDAEGRLTRIASGPLAERTLSWGEGTMEEVVLRPVGSHHERPGGATSRTMRTWRYDAEGRVLGYEETGDRQASMKVSTHHENGQIATVEVDGANWTYDATGRLVEGPGSVGRRVYDSRGFLVEHVLAPGTDHERVQLRQRRDAKGELERVELLGWPSFVHGQRNSNTPWDLPVAHHPDHICIGPLPNAEAVGPFGGCCSVFGVLLLIMTGVGPRQ